MKKWKTAAVLLGMGMLMTACSQGEAPENEQGQAAQDIKIEVQEDTGAASEENGAQEESRQEETSGESTRRETGGNGQETDGNEQEIQKDEIVVLDPGHSSVVAGGTEPLGPGSSEQKSADTSGTSGVSTGLPEYELTLRVSQKLKTELENRGYTVILTRDTNNVPVSCVQRAETAKEAGADAFVRIHANGSEDSSVQGAMTICITPDNPFYPGLYAQSRALSDSIITELCAATGCENDSVWETDSMSGNNWSKVPATIVEMGYMTNPEEDELMATDEYQNKLTQGIANGIDAYFGY